MIAMQYKITLPDNYDMNIIRQRVINNGKKTDGFQDLLFKAYLITEKDNSPEYGNEYSPLYLWKDSEGMNKFIFNGFYDNILKSFGWQKINIGVPLLSDITKDFSKSRYALEFEKDIPVTQTMESIRFLKNFSECTGKVSIYNPEKWKYIEYYFFGTVPSNIQHGKVYKILHLSM